MGDSPVRPEIYVYTEVRPYFTIAEVRAAPTRAGAPPVEHRRAAAADSCFSDAGGVSKIYQTLASICLPSQRYNRLTDY